MLGSLLTALFIATGLVAISALVLRYRGPWGTIWTFFLVLFLGVLAVSLWVRPVETQFWGNNWLPAAVAGLAIVFLMAASVPMGRPRDRSVASGPGALPEERKAAMAMGAFFWGLLVVLAVVILVGVI